MQSSQKPMRSVWHSLLWKEWHEHKWKLLVLTTGLIVLPLIFFGSLDEFDQLAILVAVSGSLLCYGVLAGLFVGMGTAASENQRGTMPFLQSLPVSMTKPATAKLLWSLLTVCVPVLVVAVTCFGYLKSQRLDEVDLAAVLDWSGRSEPFLIGRHESLASWFGVFSLMGTLFTSSFLIWMAAWGVNRSDEIRAGAIGFLAITVFWGILIGTSEWAEHYAPPIEEFLSLPMAMAAGAPGHLTAFMQEFRMPWPLIVFSSCAGHGFLLFWYLSRFGRKTIRPERTLGGLAVAENNNQWLAPPFRSRLAAIVWKQVYETGPLALMAAGAVVAMAGIAYWANRYSQYQGSFGEFLGGITLCVGFLVTVVAGMGVFLEDVKPKIGTFWRSRPINTTTWFFVKFFTGLIVLVVTFGALLLVALAFPGNARLLDPKDPYSQVAVFAAVFLQLYTLSMASYCLTRHPIYAVVAALGIFIFGVMAVEYLGRWLPLVNPHWLIPMAILVVPQLAATLLAWLAVRNNWGWHQE